MNKEQQDKAKVKRRFELKNERKSQKFELQTLLSQSQLLQPTNVDLFKVVAPPPLIVVITSY